MGPDCGWAFSRRDAWKRIPSGHTVEAKIFKVNSRKMKQLGIPFRRCHSNSPLKYHYFNSRGEKECRRSQGYHSSFPEKKWRWKIFAKVNFREMKEDRKKIIYQFWWGPSDSSLKFSPDFKSRGESEWSHPSGIVHHSRKNSEKKYFASVGCVLPV